MSLGSLVYVSILISSIVANNVIERREERSRLSDVDPLLEAVQLEEWNDDEVACLEGTLAVLQGVKNSTLWATWIWDSMQRPVGFFYGSRYQLGSFDQCMKPPWLSTHPHLRTQYCLADIHLTDGTPKKRSNSVDPYSSTGSYFDVTSKKGRYFNVLTWGLCLPSECSQRGVRKLVRIMLNMQHLTPLTREPYINVDACQLAGDHVEYSSEFYIFVLLLQSLVMMSILATIFSGYRTKNSLGSQLIESFNLKNNWYTFINDKGDIKSLNGIKCLNTVIIVWVHYAVYVHITATFNGLDAEKDSETAFGISLIRGDIILETFIFISGLLLMKGLMSGKRKNPLVGLLKRYIRILCPLAIMIFYFVVVHKYVGSGPLWPRFSSEQQELCQKNWWISLLMLSNYVRNTEMCYIVTWYISSDLQLAIAGTALFYIYQKNKRLGKLLFSISILVTALIPALVTYWYEIPANLLHDVQKILNMFDNEVFLNVYIKSHCRAVVYLLGMLMGYCMSFYKLENSRNLISQKLSMNGAAIAFYIMYKVMREGGLLTLKEYDLIEVTTYMALNKICWSVAIAILIVVCEYGYVPIISDILRFNVWGVLSKLCYSIYVVHSAVIFRHTHSARTPLTHAYFDMISNGIGVLFSIIPICLFLYLFVEAPAGNVVRCLFEYKNLNAESKQDNPIVNGNGACNANGTKKGAKSKIA